MHAKRPFGEPKQVIEYLGRYTHKVTISNSRIKNVSSSEVSFTYKDYRANGITKLMLLTSTEFIRKFAQHILPKRFVRIRHYGILSSGWKRGRLQKLQLSLNIERLPQKIAIMLRKCRYCKTGTLVTIEVLPKETGQVSKQRTTKKIFIGKQICTGDIVSWAGELVCLNNKK